MKPKGWRDLAIGAIIPDGGTSKAYKTGDWRTYKAVRDAEKCTHCLFCWIYCPDGAILSRYVVLATSNPKHILSIQSSSLAHSTQFPAPWQTGVAGGQVVNPPQFKQPNS